MSRRQEAKSGVERREYLYVDNHEPVDVSNFSVALLKSKTTLCILRLDRLLSSSSTVQKKLLFSTNWWLDNKSKNVSSLISCFIILFRQNITFLLFFIEINPDRRIICKQRRKFGSIWAAMRQNHTTHINTELFYPTKIGFLSETFVFNTHQSEKVD